MNTEMRPQAVNRLSRAGHALLALGIVAAASVLGQIATYPALPGWYAGLVKPGFTPPNLAFPIVWTLLYLAMALAFWRILGVAPGTPGRRGAIRAWLVQIVLNAGWSWAFFGSRMPWFGVVVIALLIIAIIVTWNRFRRLDSLSGWLLVPYILWVCYAAALNVAIALLNG